MTYVPSDIFRIRAAAEKLPYLRYGNFPKLISSKYLTLFVGERGYAISRTWFFESENGDDFIVSMEFDSDGTIVSAFLSDYGITWSLER